MYYYLLLVISYIIIVIIGEEGFVGGGVGASICGCEGIGGCFGVK